MRRAIAVRWTFAAAMLPVYVLLGFLYVVPNASETSPFGPHLVGEAQFALRVLIPLSAGACAFLGGQLGQHLDRRADVRSWWAGMARLTWPAPVAAGLAYILIVLGVGALNGSVAALLDYRGLLMVGAGTLLTIGWSCVGLVIGSIAPPVVAALLAVVLHLLLTWLPALATPWPRLLTGIQYGCCGPTTVPDRAALLFSILLSSALLMVAFAAAHSRRTALRRGVLLGSLGLVAIVFVLAARTLPVGAKYVLADPRPDETVCRQGKPTVCLWPENAEALPDVSSWLGSAYSSWADVAPDLPLPPRVSDAVHEAGAPGLGYRPGASRAQVQANSAYGALVDLGGNGMCAQEVPGLQTASLWLTERAGSSTEELQVGPDVRRLLEEVRRLPAEEQSRWLAEVTAGLRRCEA